MQACLLAISARTPSRRHRHDRHRFGTMQGSVSNRRTCDCRAGPAAMCGPRPSWPLAPAPHVHTPPPGFAGAPDLGNSLACNIVSTLFRDGAVRLAITAANVCCSSMPGGCWLCAVLTSSADVVVRAPPCARLRPARFSKLCQILTVRGTVGGQGGGGRSQRLNSLESGCPAQGCAGAGRCSREGRPVSTRATMRVGSAQDEDFEDFESRVDDVGDLSRPPLAPMHA